MWQKKIQTKNKKSRLSQSRIYHKAISITRLDHFAAIFLHIIIKTVKNFLIIFIEFFLCVGASEKKRWKLNVRKKIQANYPKRGPSTSRIHHKANCMIILLPYFFAHNTQSFCSVVFNSQIITHGTQIQTWLYKFTKNSLRSNHLFLSIFTKKIISKNLKNIKNLKNLIIVQHVF